MTTTPTTTTVLAYIRHWINRARAETASDAALLHRFTQEGDETAFAFLMDRHGPMVLGTARRLVGDEHLAEDVFQAAFLTLARKAGRLRRAAALPAWLHTITCRLALTALRQRQRRQRAESQAAPRAIIAPSDAAISHEQLAILDEELQNLPERFRLPLILCCLEGRSQAEAAALLGWQPSSVKGRLERGRNRLRARLARRGLTLAVATALPAVDHPTLAASLRDTVLRTARSGATTTPLVSGLLKEACKPVFAANWKAILLVAILGIAGAGLGIASRLTGPTPAISLADPPPAAAEDKPSSKREELDPEALPSGAVARLGSARLRIGNAAFALTPDGRAIVTVTPQGLVRRFDAVTGKLLERKQLSQRSDVDPMGQFYAQLSEDGRMAAIQDQSDTGPRVSVWDLTSGERLFRRSSGDRWNIGLFKLSPDGKRLAVVEHDYSNSRTTTTLRVFDVRTGGMKGLGNLGFNVYYLSFSADSKRMVVSHSSEEPGGSFLTCFDVTIAKELWKVPPKGAQFAFSPDGKTVVAAGSDKNTGLGFSIIETDPDSGKPRESFTQDFAAHPNIRMVIAPDNRTVVLNHFGEIVLWDYRSRKEIRRFALPRKNDTSGYGPDVGAISPDSRTLVTNVGHLQRWDLTTGKPFFAAPPDDGLAGPIQHIAFTPDGKELFASSWGLTSGRWNLATKKRIGFAHEVYSRQLIRTPNGIRTLKMDWFQKPHEVTLIDPLAGRTLTTVRWTVPKEVTINGQRAYTLTADGKTLLVAHGKEPGDKQQTITVTACAVATGRRLARFTVPGEFYFERSPFSPCGRWVVIGEKVYNIGSGTALFAPAGEPDERLVAWDRETRGSIWFSEDSRLMAGLLLKKGEKSTINKTLTVWELATGNVVARYPKAGFIAQTAFSPDGRVLALLDGRGIRLEDLRTGKRLAEYAAPDVTCELTDRGCTTQTLVFSPDGATLATGHLDGTILLWQVSRPDAAVPTALADGETEKLWADLGSVSRVIARTAVDRLARHPDIAITLLAKRFRPPPGDAKLVALIADLDSDNFAAREEAARKLRVYGTRAETALRGKLVNAPSLEMRRRIEGILEEMTPPSLSLPLSGERLRGVRAIEVLERIGNAAARDLLHSWAEQTEDVHLAVEARLALERLPSAKR